MTDWKALLSELSEAVMSLESFDEDFLKAFGVPGLTESDRESKWLGFPAASETEIEEAETRLGIKLPPTLREFYLVSNGWRQIDDFIYEIVPVQKLNWFKDLDPVFCEDCTEVNELSVARSICLSQKGDATTLLIDPENRTESGEWIVGAWASWYPGFECSELGFADFMIRKLEECRASNNEGEQDSDGQA
ncbi:MAG: SMI1/KNR4 family protein [Verrucomicrobiales bacterium]|nr:SMI1/KNR4 family protein [Verrucomicrobiales bacterium]